MRRKNVCAVEQPKIYLPWLSQQNCHCRSRRNFLRRNQRVCAFTRSHCRLPEKFRRNGLRKGTVACGAAEELQRIKKEIQRTYDLYQQEKLDGDGFTKFYAPLEERRKQVEVTLPRLEAELDILRVNNVSAEEIATQASNLYDHWQTIPPEQKREIIEVIADTIVVGKDEITINLSYSPSSKDMANRWRKGRDLNPR